MSVKNAFACALAPESLAAVTLLAGFGVTDPSALMTSGIVRVVPSSLFTVRLHVLLPVRSTVTVPLSVCLPFGVWTELVKPNVALPWAGAIPELVA
jgi:hypothetical protein